jgi:hypothetical protein
VNRSFISILAGLLVLVIAEGSCCAGPPTRSKGSGPWYNPMQWQMPSMPWSSEQPRIRKKSQGVMTDMNQSAKRGWAKTKSALDPSKMFVSDPNPAPQKSEPGFWDGLFGPSKSSEDVRTVNDFLSQPHPR